MSHEEPIYEAIDSIFAAERSKKDKERMEEVDILVKAAREVLKSKAGRTLFWWLISRGNLFASTYTGRSLDQAHLDGQRVIAAEMFSLALKADTRILDKMINDRIIKEDTHD